MDRGRKAMPIQNKQCNDRYVRMCQDRHKAKLRDMKCSIDNKMPKQASHLKTNAKKNALMEERFAIIESENRMLLEKMSYIIAKKGGVDNKNDSLQYGRSLNKDRRKRELQKITKQNQTILSRIQESQPTYDHLTWAEEARVSHQFMLNVCEFKPKGAGQDGVHVDDDGAEPDNF